MKTRVVASEGDLYRQARTRMRRRPSWLLRRRERRIVASPRPGLDELAVLAAVRRELRVRAVSTTTLGWWRRG